MLHRHASPAVAAAYTGGAIAGALTTTTTFLVLSGFLRPLPSTWRTILAVCLLGLLGLRAARIVCLDLPQRRYQIPRSTFGPRPPQAAFRFALELGTGVRTYITSSSPYAIAIVLLLCLPASLVSAALAATVTAIGYGLGRSVVVAGQSMRRSIAVEHPAVWLRLADAVALASALAIATLW